MLRYTKNDHQHTRIRPWGATPFGLLTYLLTYSLTPWNRVHSEKLIVCQPVKKFPAFYVTRKFITALTSFRHLSPSWARSIQFRPVLPVKDTLQHYIPIYVWVFQESSWSQVSPPKLCIYLSRLQYLSHAPSNSCFLIRPSEQYLTRSAKTRLCARYGKSR
jgi:hypothetical protein